VSVPRGFALLLESATAGGWGWVAYSHPGVIEAGKIIDHKRVVVETEGVKTVVIAWRGGQAGARARSLMAWWANGKFAQGWHRDVRDPAPSPVGARELRPLFEDGNDETAPRWVRPDLERDEGTPPGRRWAPEIEQRVQDGMDRLRAHGQQYRRNDNGTGWETT
jgi:hypothetical protein